jgi:hypothetical protein
LQSWRSEKHNCGQHQQPSGQQHQETHSLHSEIPRFHAKTLAVTETPQVKISQSHRNPTRRANNNQCGSRETARDDHPDDGPDIRTKTAGHPSLFLMHTIEVMNAKRPFHDVPGLGRKDEDIEGAPQNLCKFLQINKL